MSRIKELRELPENKVNIVNVLELLVPDVKNNTKYTDALLRMFHNDIKLEEKTLNERIKEFDVTNEKLAALNKMEKIYLSIVLNEKENRSVLLKFAEFVQFNEKGAIAKNDLQAYKSFNDMFEQYDIAKEKEVQKLLEKQVIKLIDDENWFAIIPLTYEASLKYGSSTKWCTASKDYPNHYENYTRKGVLIYTRNKKTKKKFAGYCEIKESGRRKEITFWDEADNKVDGMACSFSTEMYAIFMEQFKFAEPGNTNIPTIEKLRKKVLGTTNPNGPALPKKKVVKASVSGGMDEPTAEGINAPTDENADYSDIYNTIVNYMGGRR